MQQPFKCCKIGRAGNITEMHIFLGERIGKDGVEEAQKTLEAGASGPLFEGVFTSGDHKEAAVKLGRVNALVIHDDDSVMDVKRKLCQVSAGMTLPATYLFATAEIAISADSIYQKLSGKKKTGIPRARFESFVKDVEALEHPVAENDPPFYDYEAVMQLELDKKPLWKVSRPLGVGFQEEYACPANPWLAFADSPANSNSNAGQLLMTGGNVVDHVIKFVDLEELSKGEYNYLGYFPALLSKGISSMAEYEREAGKLRKESIGMCSDPTFERRSRDIDVIYAIGNSKERTQTVGLKRGNITLHTPAPFTLPLDIVFKLLHTDTTRPLTKYNPGRRREKIYRLYADREATNGRKIPYLPKSTIFRLTKVLATEKQVSVFIVAEDQPVILNFHADSSISIVFVLKLPLPEDELLKFLKSACNPVIESVNAFMVDRGYVLRPLDKLDSHYVQIDDIEVVVSDKLTSSMDIESSCECMSAVLSLDSITSEGAINLTYTRVDDFNKMDAIDSFITTRINSGLSELDILDALVSQFNLKDREQAKARLLDFISQQQVVRDAFRSSRVKIRSNPGFKVTVTPDRFKGKVHTSIEGINDYGYLLPIGLYIRSLMLLSLGLPIPGVPKAQVTSLCNAPVPAKLATPKAVIKAINPGDAKAKEDLMQMLMSETDSETDSETESDAEEQSPDSGAAAVGREGGVVEGDVDVSGMKLLNPNPFSLLLQEREPSLFRSRKDKTTYSYARSCPSNNKRQPVILTTDEKARIDKEHPGSYTHSISYRASPDATEYHYICPRYWDLNRKTSLTAAEAQSGDYGGIIPQGERKVPTGSSIYEFDGAYHRDSAGQHRPLHPGFMRPESHPEGKCIPCCFKTWDAPSRVKLRKECNRDEGDEPGEKRQGKFDDYIKGPEKWPLEKGRIGYLPVSIELFMQVSNSKCQISKSDANIKPNTPCLLRQGCESSKTRSFIAAIAQLYHEAHGGSLPSVADMTSTLTNDLTLDAFSALQNGSLVPIFANLEDSRKDHLPSSYPDSTLAK